MPQLVRDGLALVRAFVELLVAISPLLPPLMALLVVILHLLVESGLLILIIRGMILMINAATSVFRALSRVIDAITSPLRGARQGVESFGRAVSDNAGKAIGVFRNLGSTVKNAVSNFGSLLFNAGRNLIQGLINGIKNKIPSLGGLIESAANVVRSYWPFSPAKRGPLSGSGDMLLAGRNVVGRLVSGMQGRIGDVSVASRRLAEAMGAPGGMQGPGGFAMAGAGTGGASLGSSDRFFGPYQMLLNDKVLTEFVVDAVTGAPQEVAAATDEGRRERGFAFSPRARR
jgi:hypothetical protein